MKRVMCAIECNNVSNALSLSNTLQCYASVRKEMGQLVSLFNEHSLVVVVNDYRVNGGEFWMGARGAKYGAKYKYGDDKKEIYSNLLKKWSMSKKRISSILYSNLLKNPQRSEFRREARLHNYNVCQVSESDPKPTLP